MADATEHELGHLHQKHPHTDPAQTIKIWLKSEPNRVHFISDLTRETGCNHDQANTAIDVLVAEGLIIRRGSDGQGFRRAVAGE